MGGFHRFKRADEVVEEHSATHAIKTSNWIEEDETPLHKLEWHHVKALLDAGLLQPPRPCEIQDRSKSDWIAKSLVLVQITWFIAQCIGRRAQHLPLTELEVVTLAYTVVNVVIYAVWWEKPYHVAEPVRVYHDKPASWEWDTLGSKRTIFVLVIAGTVFGAMHFIAWASLFPTPLERLLWRISTIVLTGMPIVTSLAAWLLERLPIKLGDQFEKVVATIISVVYFVGRVENTAGRP